jgi:hypothetical protein
MGIGTCGSDRSRNLRSASRLPSDLGVNLSYGVRVSAVAPLSDFPVAAMVIVGAQPEMAVPLGVRSARLARLRV